MSDYAKMLSELARSGDVSPEKMRLVIEAVTAERQTLARNAFTEAFLKLQAELPEIDENGAMVRDGKEISKYSKWEDIQRVLKPLLVKHGFTLSFNNTFPQGGMAMIEVLAVLTHRDGHHTENAFRLHADDSMANENQAMGSSQSYGMRYATLGLLNIITRGADVDMGDLKKIYDAVADEPLILDREVMLRYRAALAKLTKAAAKGQAAFARASKKVTGDLFAILVDCDKATYAKLKRQAVDADAKKEAA